MKKYEKILSNNFLQKDIKNFIELYNLREKTKDFYLQYSPWWQSKRFINILFEAVIRPEYYLNEIKKKLNNLKNKIINSSSKYGSTEICFILNKEFELNKIVFKDLNQDNPEKYVDTGGTNPDDFTILVLCFYNVIDIQDSKEIYDKFIEQVLYILGHEFIHREQMLNIREKELRKRLFPPSIKTMTNKKDKDYKYLSQKHEIMSYAWQIVEYMRLTGEKDKEIRKILQSSDEKKFAYNPILLWYHNVFKDINNSTLKLLYKYMYGYLEK